MSDATLHPPPRPPALLPSSRSADRPLLLAIATIMALACAAAIGARATWSASAAWTNDLTGAMTVQLTPGDGDDEAALVTRAATALNAAPGVASVRVVSDEEIDSLLSPWLGEGALPDDLPLPSLIDVRLDPLAPAAPDALMSALNEAGVEALIDDHASWASNLESTVGAARALALASLTLLLAAAMAVTAFATNASLAMRRDVVELLHVSGARDGFIADVFTRRFLILGLKAGVAGAVLTAFGALIYHLAGAGAADAFLPQFRLALWDAPIVAATPLGAALVAGFTARRTVVGVLQGLY